MNERTVKTLAKLWEMLRLGNMSRGSALFHLSALKMSQVEWERESKMIREWEGVDNTDEDRALESKGRAWCKDTLKWHRKQGHPV